RKDLPASAQCRIRPRDCAEAPSTTPARPGYPACCIDILVVFAPVSRRTTSESMTRLVPVLPVPALVRETPPLPVELHVGSSRVHLPQIRPHNSERPKRYPSVPSPLRLPASPPHTRGSCT